MKTITCLHPKYLIPIEPANTVWHEHALVFSDQTILAVLPSAQALARFPEAQHQRLEQHALLPGLVNLHAHSAMSLMRGLADDLSLMEWLNQHIWPAEKQHVSQEFVYDGTQFAMAEMLRGGTTTVNDMYFHHTAVARAGVTTGMRTVIGCSILEFPTNFAPNADAYLERAMAAITEFRDQPGISFKLAPHAPYTVSDASFKKILTLADQHDLGLHCHIHESADEIANSLKEYGMRPLARLHRLGFLRKDLIAAHMVHANAAEIELLALTQTHVAHNPASNLKLASGIAPIHAMHCAGVNVGLGTDGAASNNKLDMLADLRLAALLAKAQSGNPSALAAHAALDMATLAGAKALGLEASIGSLVAGKCADMIALDLSAAETQPLYDPISHIVYAAGREQVSHVWVNGRCLMQARRLLSLDLAQVQDKAAWWQARIGAAARVSK